MTIQIKDQSVVKEIEVSEMSAVRGGIGGQGLSGGTLPGVVSTGPANLESVETTDFSITKYVDKSTPTLFR